MCTGLCTLVTILPVRIKTHRSQGSLPSENSPALSAVDTHSEGATESGLKTLFQEAFRQLYSQELVHCSHLRISGLQLVTDGSCKKSILGVNLWVQIDHDGGQGRAVGPKTHSGVWTCDEVSLKKSSLGRRICHTHKIPRTLVLLVPEVSIQVLGFARPCPIKLSHLMKEVHGVCVSPVFCSPARSLTALILWVVFQKD